MKLAREVTCRRKGILDVWILLNNCESIQISSAMIISGCSGDIAFNLTDGGNRLL